METPEAHKRTVAVILMGGPTKGTRFRPLSFNLAKPLFPLAGQPMVHHPILACKKIPDLTQVYLIGFYEEKEFSLYISALSNELKVPVRYLREDRPHGSAGGLYKFQDLLMDDDPTDIVVLNCDVCCSFPLTAMLAAHRKHGGIGTLLVKKVSKEVASEFGELVADSETGELLHYAEKPETFVSDFINCGVYIFTPEIFLAIKDVSSGKHETSSLRRLSSFEALYTATNSRQMQADFVRLDQDILTPLAGKKKLYTFQTNDFWEQIKTPGMSLRCSSLYLAQYRVTTPELLATGDGKRSPTIVGDVFIHRSAKVHPTAKLGPNVSVSANARIGPGARLIGCIILDDVEIKENAVVMHSIVGWKSSLGRWARVQRGAAQRVLRQLQEHPDAWTGVVTILQHSSTQNSKFYALQVLEGVIKYRWNALPVEQRDGIKNYISDLIVQLSSNEASFRKEKLYVNKLNIILVQVLKQEWPARWPRFIPDLVAAAKSSETLCENCMVILKLLSEEVFDFSLGELTQSKIKEFKNSLNREFQLVHELCQYVLSISQRPELIRATLSTLHAFLSWIPLGYIFESALLETLLKLFPVPSYRNLTLQCLSELTALSCGDHYDAHYVKLYPIFMVQLQIILPPGTNVPEAYGSGSDDDQAFIQNLAMFFTSFSKCCAAKMHDS